MLAADRLSLAIQAHRRISPASRLLAPLRSGGIDELRRLLQSLGAEPLENDAERAEELDQEGVGVTFLGEELYPPLLAKLASPPPYIYFLGNGDLLREPGIGICGARDASEQGLEAARIAGKALARAGLPIVSGNARGVDTEAHLAAIREGGGAIFVLAEGIAGFRPKRAFILAGLDWNRTLVLSQFAPSQRWAVGGAMKRNGLIVGLGLALVVIEASERGGTLDAGLKALRLGRPVLALGFRSGSPLGNSLLVSRGAKKVSSTGELVHLVQGLQSDLSAGQLPLFSTSG